jgi:hypothetical protein
MSISVRGNLKHTEAACDHTNSYANAHTAVMKGSVFALHECSERHGAQMAKVHGDEEKHDSYPMM